MQKHIYNTTAILILSIGALVIGLFDMSMYVLAYLDKVDHGFWYVLVIGNVSIAYTSYRLADFFMIKADKIAQEEFLNNKRYFPENH